MKCDICEAELYVGDFYYEDGVNNFCVECLLEYIGGLARHHMDIDAFESHLVPDDIDGCEQAHALKEEQMLAELHGYA